MKKIMILLALGVGLALLAGCEWKGGSSVDTFNDDGNYLDFSGSYKAPDGGVLVRQFGVTNAAGTTNTTVTTNTVSDELLGTGDGTNTAFSGALAHSPVRGSLTILVGAYSITDHSASPSADTVALTVTPNDGTTGTLNYGTRVWALVFPAPLAEDSQILASYLWTESHSDTAPTTQGNHGSAIYSFVIYQTGNKIQIIDSNGSTYDGYIGSVKTTGGDPVNMNSATPTTGPVTAQFSATGYSQGYNVQIVGALEGTLAGRVLTVRYMRATYIEENGNQADLYCQAL